MKKVILSIYLFLLSFVLFSCDKGASLIDCNLKLDAYKTKMELNNGVVVDSNIDVFVEGGNMYNVNTTSDVMFEPLYIKLVNGTQTYHLIERRDKIYTVDKLKDRYIASYFCDDDELDDEYNFDSNYDEYFSLKSLPSLKIKNIDSGYKITYDLAEYFDSIEDGVVKNMYDKIVKESIMTSSLAIDIKFINEEKINMIYFYEIDLRVDGGKERIQIVQTLNFQIAKVTPITSLDQCYLEVHRYLSSSIDNTIADLSGFDKFYLNSFDSGYTRIAFEKGTYEINSDSENVTITLYDINKNKVESVDGKTFNVNMDIYFIHFNTTEDAWLTVTKK